MGNQWSGQGGAFKLYAGLAVLCVVLIVSFVLYKQDGAGTASEVSPPSYSEVDKSALEEWVATMSCGPAPTLDDGLSPAFDESRTLLVGEGVVILERGKYKRFFEMVDPEVEVPGELPFRFEWWFGHIDSPKVSIEGWYTEGNDTVKRIEFSGYQVDGQLKFSGRRGPRQCEVEASPKV